MGCTYCSHLCVSGQWVIHEWRHWAGKWREQLMWVFNCWKASTVSWVVTVGCMCNSSTSWLNKRETYETQAIDLHDHSPFHLFYGRPCRVAVPGTALHSRSKVGWGISTRGSDQPATNGCQRQQPGHLSVWTRSEADWAGHQQLWLVRQHTRGGETFYLFLITCTLSLGHLYWTQLYLTCLSK